MNAARIMPRRRYREPREIKSDILILLVLADGDNQLVFKLFHFEKAFYSGIIADYTAVAVGWYNNSKQECADDHCGFSSENKGRAGADTSNNSQIYKEENKRIDGIDENYRIGCASRQLACLLSCFKTQLDDEYHHNHAEQDSCDIAESVDEACEGVIGMITRNAIYCALPCSSAKKYRAGQEITSLQGLPAIA